MKATSTVSQNSTTAALSSGHNPGADSAASRPRGEFSLNQPTRQRLPVLFTAFALLLLAVSSLHAQQCVSITCPTNQTYYVCNTNGLWVYYSPVASNSCNPTNLTVVCSPPSGHWFTLGATTVDCTAYGSGYSNHCSFTVTVLPDPKCQPTNCIDLHCSTNITAYACGSNCVSVPFSVWANNLCNSNAVSVSTDYPSGYCFPLGTTTVHATATLGGQTAPCSFDVTVLPNPNCQPQTNCPIAHCSTNVVRYMPCGSNCVPVYYSTWAENPCNPGNVQLLTSPMSGTCFTLGDHTVDVWAWAGDQTNHCSFTVSVLPDPNCQQQTNCPIAHCWTNVVRYMPCGSNCVPVYYSTWAENPCNPGNVQLLTSPMSGTCFTLGDHTVDVWAWASGQTNHCSFTVTVLPDPNCQPTPCIDLHCPTNLTGYVCGSNCVSVPFSVWASNRCNSNAVPVVTDYPPGYCFPLGTTWVNATASANGESVQCSFPVTVLPNPNCPPPCTNCSNCSSNLLVNGSFELPSLADGYAALPGGDSTISGWVALLNGLQYYNPLVAPLFVNTGFAADGLYLVDLAPTNGLGGGIQQTFPTVAGRSYRVSFALGTSKERGRNGTASLTATVAGEAHAFNVSTENPAITWERKEFSFIALSTSATLVFSTLDDPALNFVNLDDVRVSDCCTDPGLKIRRTVTVEWKCGILQSAPLVTGPYADVPGATSPYTVDATDPQRYFRTR